MRRAAIVGFAACLLLFAGGSATTSASTMAGANMYWGIGIEAGLPANAATTTQNVSVNSISCASVGNCSAVGTYVDSSGYTQGLLLTETAGVWATGVEAVLPADAATTNPHVALNSVSCASAGNCTAVGLYVDNSVNDNGQGLLLTETSGTWAAGVEAALPANATSTNQDADLGSVSCASAGNCSAVGAYRTSSLNNVEALALTETAGSWSPGVEVALPANAATFNNVAGLYSVSCPSAGNCSAVGGYLSMPTGDSWASQGLLVNETAGNWSTGVEAALPANATTPNPGAGVGSVSCASAGNCSAVGLYNDEAVLLTETAGSWATGIEAALPANASGSPLVEHPAISCASAGNCGATATYYDNSANNIRQGVMFTQTGGTWATGVEATLPADADTTIFQSVDLSSISCPSAGNCSVVGGYNVSSGEGAGLLLTETAGSWATGTEVALPANGSSGSINSISCPSAGNCSGAGGYGVTSAGGGNQGLLLATTTTPPKEALTVSETGPGTVTSSPSGLDCGSTCASSFDYGTAVTLTATPSAHSVFEGWSGSCSGSGTCQLTLDHAANVSANFAPQSYDLTVQLSGAGTGTVTGTPPGNLGTVDCGPTGGPDCDVSFNWGTQVTLDATAGQSSVFKGWSGGGCSGKQVGCQVTVAADTTVTATFAKVQCVVPKVRGKSLSNAESDIYDSFCTVGKVTKKASRTVRKGHVISQSPPPGRHLKKDSKVSLVVSKGKHR